MQLIEFRVVFPLGIEEYKIAHLYMMMKRSRYGSMADESERVDIIMNEPYKDGPGGEGQYTHKVFYFGSQLPHFLRAMTKTSRQLHEFSWNAYPYTKSAYKCTKFEALTVVIETIYASDLGHQSNIFGLSELELANRSVEFLDIANIHTQDNVKPEENPRYFVSTKTGRGPLTDNWIKDLSDLNQKDGCGEAEVICAYKLCRIEFNYRLLQSKIEKVIVDYVRKQILRASRLAWVWQDEWYQLTLQDIRRMETETKEILSKGSRKSDKKEDEPESVVTSTIAPETERSIEFQAEGHGELNKFRLLNSSDSKETSSKTENKNSHSS